MLHYIIHFQSTNGGKKIEQNWCDNIEIFTCNLGKFWKNVGTPYFWNRLPNQFSSILKYIYQATKNNNKRYTSKAEKNRAKIELEEPNLRIW